MLRVTRLLFIMCSRQHDPPQLTKKKTLRQTTDNMGGDGKKRQQSGEDQNQQKDCSPPKRSDDGGFESGGGRVRGVPPNKANSVSGVVSSKPVTDTDNTRTSRQEKRRIDTGEPANIVSGTVVGQPSLPSVVEYSAMHGEDAGWPTSEDVQRRIGVVEQRPQHRSKASAQGLPSVRASNPAPVEGGLNSSISPNVGVRSGHLSSATMPAPAAAAAAAAVTIEPAITGPQSPSTQSPALERQLRRFVSQKLEQDGDLDQAGICALDALSKMARQPAAQASKTASMAQKPSIREHKVRNTPPGLRDVPKFSGKDPSILKDTLRGFSACVKVGLNRPEITAEDLNTAHLRDVVFVLEDPAKEWFRLLMKGRVVWEPTVPPDTDPDADDMSAAPPMGSETDTRVRPPSTWKEVCDALEDNFLPAEGVSRTCMALLSMRQAPGESVRSYAGRQLALNHHLNRLMQHQKSAISVWEVLQIGIFEKGLVPHLRRAQRAEPACTNFEECLARAEVNDVIVSASRAKTIEAAAADSSDNICSTKTKLKKATDPTESPSTNDDAALDVNSPTKSSSSDRKTSTAAGKNEIHERYDKAIEKVPSPNDDESRARQCEEKTAPTQGVNHRPVKRVRNDSVNRKTTPTHDTTPRPPKRVLDDSGDRSRGGGRRRTLQGPPPQRRPRDHHNGRCEIPLCRNPQNHTTNECFHHPQFGKENRRRSIELREIRRKKHERDSGQRGCLPGREDNYDSSSRGSAEQP